MISACTHTLFTYFWWTILFCLFCFFFYERAIKDLKEEYAQLETHLSIEKSSLEEALQLQQRLKLQVNSQDDPKWIELTLMKQLGVVREGDKKYLFVP